MGALMLLLGFILIDWHGVDVSAAESMSRTVQCPHCSESFDVSWKTSDVTSESGQDDEDKEGDGVDGAGQDDDDQDDDRELDAKAKSRMVAELLARKRRR